MPELHPIVWVNSDDESDPIVIIPSPGDDEDELVRALSTMSMREVVDRTLYRMDTPRGVRFTANWNVLF